MTKVSILKSISPGDVIILLWRDHLRTHDRKIVGAPTGLVESFGQVAEITDEIIALFQNRVTNADVIGAEECMDGQLVLTCDIVGVELIKKVEV